MVPLTMWSIGLDGVAQRVSSPTGATSPTVEFFLPAIMSISGDVFYQVLFRGVEVVGICTDRVIH
jgi:hypothetical protein